MGLFRRSSPAEKKLKSLTGGFLLSTSFINMLKEHNIKLEDGNKIKNQLKDEIKQGTLNENNVEVRLKQLIKQYSKTKNPSSQKNCPECNEPLGFDNTFCTKCGYKFENTIMCPICNSPQDSSNHYCINCGYDFTKKTAHENEKKCPNCHNYQNIKRTLCSDCGYDFKSEQMPKIVKKCPECDLIQKGTNIFCRKCKHNLRDVDYEPCSELTECENCNRLIPKNKNYCPFCKFDIKTAKLEKAKKEEETGKLEKLYETDNIRQTRFLNNFDFNLKNCPECNTPFLKTDPFCFNCGSSVLTSDTVRNDNLDIEDGKLINKSEKEENDELSNLEVLYNQTVQSKYSPEFKFVYVLYLDEIRKNPLKKFSSKTARKYETTVNKLKKQATTDAFIELASPLIAASDLKVTELKDILKEHNLKVSGKKDDLIERLGENLSDDELKKHFKSKNYQISEKGLDFLTNNNYIPYITGKKDISNALYPVEISKIFEEKEYSESEIHSKLLSYFKSMLDKKLKQELWVDYKLYSNAIAQVLEDSDALKEALNIRFKIFLFDINNYSLVLNKPEPSKTKLKRKDMVKITKLMHKLTLSIDELKELFNNACNEVLFKTIITNEDSLIYLLKIFGGEYLDSVSKEINEKYSNPY